MTIHQAKNREFDNVLVLWPVQVPSDPEAQRRLLYNALTRAKNLATVIVQDPVSHEEPIEGTAIFDGSHDMKRPILEAVR